jgi:hypothetical protein
VTRRFSRIRSTAVVALAAAAVAAPAAVADGPAFHHRAVVATAGSAPVVGDPVGDRVSPATDTQLVGDPVGDRIRPATDAQLVGDPVGDRFGPAAHVDVTPRTAPASAPVAQPNQFDWTYAGIGAGALALLLVGIGTAKSVRTRRGLVRAA